MVEPHAMSDRTQNSCVGMPRRVANSLQQFQVTTQDTHSADLLGTPRAEAKICLAL